MSAHDEHPLLDRRDVDDLLEAIAGLSRGIHQSNDLHRKSNELQKRQADNLERIALHTEQLPALVALLSRVTTNGADPAPHTTEEG